MTRVLVIDASGNLWGSERALLDLLPNLPMCEVAVCLPPATPLNAKLAGQGIRVLPYFVYNLHHKSRWHRLRAALGVLRACLEFRPDVIHLNQSGCYRVAWPAAALLDLPIVAHIRLFEDASYLAAQRLSRRRVSSIVAISGAIESEVRRFSSLDTIPLRRVYDPYAASASPGSSRASAQISNRVACVGRIDPNKGHAVLIRALGQLRRWRHDVECIIVGDGEEKYVQELKQFAAVEAADNSLRWLGFVEDVMPILRTCSVLVCPSHREALGRVILEAWDAGAVPIVFSGSGGAAEIVTAAAAGILYDSQEPESLAEALRTALALDGPEREALVANGRRWTSAHCDQQQCGAVLGDILSNAVRGRA